MDSSTKTIFTRINNENKLFGDIVEKVTKKEKLTSNEYSYALSLSLLFYNEYQATEKSGYLEFSYYLVLNYSLSTNDFDPLLMFSVNNGLYPISKSIFNNYDKKIQDVFYEFGIDEYKRNNIYELKKQFESRKRLIESNAKNRAYIAPTSYGKSSAIVDDIQNCPKNKIGIIVPKKALIWQTFRNIKEVAKKLKYKILLHDAEYSNEDKVICIFTQERALRLIQDSGFKFDILYIDEAHNLFEKDERNILLARLIKLNKKKNPEQKIVYLSPLIKEANDLMLDNKDAVEMYKIDFNIKELNIRYLSKELKLQAYNRFVDKFYNINLKYNNEFEYIFKNQGEKNLLYFNRPKDVEDFAQKLMEHISTDKVLQGNLSSNPSIIEISNMIAKYVDADYKLVDMLKCGIVYLHGKMPDSIRDYLLDKFTSIKELKYLISNSSVLEGMNLSIDTLFIFDVHGLKQNNLINLCGRVNRLSDVFSSNNLSKLLCNINFIDTKGKGANFRSKISMLRSDEKDDIKNPLLEKAKDKLDEKGKEIAKRENDYINNYLQKDIKTILIKNGISSMYNNLDQLANHISKIRNHLVTKSKNLIDKISYTFFYDCSIVNDCELARLCKKQTIKFYTEYIKNNYHKDLKSKVKYFNAYFKYSQNENYYIGDSFGEIPSEFNPNRNVYVNIKSKSPKEKINLAVIKSKIEDDFISFKIGKLVKTLFDLEMINQCEYNEFEYGTNDKKRLEFIKFGLSPIIMTFIDENSLENDISFKNGEMVVSKKFMQILDKQDDFIKFEINKIVS